MKYIVFFFLLFIIFSCKKEMETYNGNEMSIMTSHPAPYKGVVVLSNHDLYYYGFIYVDAKCNLYALINNLSGPPRLNKINSNEEWGWSEGEWPGLFGMYVDKNEVVYLTTAHDVQKHSPVDSGQSVFDITAAGFSRSFNSKTDSKGNFYIAVDGAVIKWVLGSGKSNIVAGGSGSETADNHLGTVAAIDFDINGAVYTAEYANQRIRKWEKGASASTTIFQTNQTSDECIPGVAVDENSNVYVIDQNKRIIKFSPGATKCQVIIDQTTPCAGKNFHPVYLFCDKRGSLYILDQGNGRIIGNGQITKWNL